MSDTLTATPASNAPDAWVTAHPGHSPLVLDSPHSGTFYPADFRTCCPLPVLRRAEDTHVEKIYDFAQALGAAWVEAHFPRSYLDANRDVVEIDPMMLDAPWPEALPQDPALQRKVRLGKGLIWKYTDDGLPLYDRLLPIAEVQDRIARCWQPYHAAVAAAIDAAVRSHGYCLHINCHSMPSVAASHATEFPGAPHADFVVGDRDGTTAHPALSQWLCHLLRERGYSVDYNHPYKGVELVRRYSDPSAGRHSIQLEINRRLYMDEETLSIHPDGMERLRRDLREVLTLLRDKPPGDWPG